MAKDHRNASLRQPAIAAILTGLCLGASLPALAAGYGDQAEWAQRYDAAPRLAVTRSNTPVLSQQTLAATEQAIETYRQIVAAGGWNMVPASSVLKLGVSGPSVVALRKRLVASGDLDASAGASPVFDSFVEAGVKHFQARHGLLETGLVSKDTFAALNAPADLRLHQLEINLVRLRSYSGNLGERFVMANIPAMAVETVENGAVATHHAAGVGKIDRQSPVMMTKATDINFNPFWTVPPSLIKKDLIPRMQKNPDYLTEHKIRIFDKDNQEVPPSQIDWTTNQATNYRYRQDPGGDINSLGVVRINISNPYGVYMHDTPEKGVFGDDFRFVSSGCIRVQNVRDYVAWLLKDTPGWDRDHIDEAIRSGQRIDAKLATPVPVYWVYITAWSTPEGLIQFRDDIYQRDGFEPTASSGAGAPLQQAIQPDAERPISAASARPLPMNDDDQQ
ncbi:L,D-transpeptidase family protein [Methylocella silvestris]|uniref:Murein L,D-transpeptidase n=1 Tax=Methylocella silvestris TaxID=199596 RepID=A0A2J7THR0_METSI|nr:L,D-transpeptidase family protein [Methylocella silvestris]PNG26311.1 murein L,D-transpeptidase [Methylocella silvestris]